MTSRLSFLFKHGGFQLRRSNSILKTCQRMMKQNRFLGGAQAVAPPSGACAQCFQRTKLNSVRKAAHKSGCRCMQQHLVSALPAIALERRGCLPVSACCSVTPQSKCCPWSPHCTSLTLIVILWQSWTSSRLQQNQTKGGSRDRFLTSNFLYERLGVGPYPVRPLRLAFISRPRQFVLGVQPDGVLVRDPAHAELHQKAFQTPR